MAREMEKVPMMMYTAIDAGGMEEARLMDGKSREERKRLKADNIHLGLGYVNVVLPSFIPCSPSPSSSSVDENEEGRRRDAFEEKIFWHRARRVRKHLTEYVKSPLAPSRAISIYKERMERAIRFAKEDDAENPSLRDVAWDPSRTLDVNSCESPALEFVYPPTVAASDTTLPNTTMPTRTLLSPLPSDLPTPPSQALLGLSVIGSLDNLYAHETYPSLRILRAYSSNRSGKGQGMLIFSRTLHGLTSFSMRVDLAGFEGSTLNAFWEEFEEIVRGWMSSELESNRETGKEGGDDSAREMGGAFVKARL